VIVEVAVAQGVADEPLGQEFLHGVIAIAMVARLGKGLGEAGGETEAGIALAEQRAALAGEVAAGETGHDLAATEVGKEQWLSRTDCRA
jgi:hypothetical protein